MEISLPDNLLTQAQQLAQAGIAVFPVGADKRPAIKGWREAATTEALQLHKWFDPDNGKFRNGGIGVPCGPEQDLICFDVDLGHTDDPERKQKLLDWVAKHRDDDGIMVRKTRSGGLHMICWWPSEVKRVPRRIMPKLDVIIEGFYFVWNTAANDYVAHAGRQDFDELIEAPADMCKVVEAVTGGDGSAMMSAEEAHEVMMTDGDAGMRHDALLRMTHDWAQDNPDDSIDVWCSDFEAWFRSFYEDRIDADRLDQLMEWDVERMAGELFRAFNGVKRSTVPTDLLSKAAEKLAAKGRLSVAGAMQVESAKASAQRLEQLAAEFTEIDLDELIERELEDIDWIVEDVIPARNLIGLAGPSGSGKTRVVSALLAALCSGQTEKLGLPPAKRPIKTLYVANEERTSDVERRLKAAALANGITGDLPIVVRGKDHGQLKLVRPDGEESEGYAAVESYVMENGVELVVFDPFVTLGVEEENSAAGVDGVMAAMQKLTNRAAVLFVHHTPKDRALPADEYRGDPSAFRGHGSIYSALDIAVTVFPYLSPSCHGKQDGKSNRRKLAQAIRDKKVPKFIALDSTKERESEGFPSLYFRLDGQEVRVGGKPIGAVVPVYEQDAEAVYEGILRAMPDSAVDRKKHKAWAAAMLEKYPRTVELSLQQLVNVLDDAEPLGWKKQRDRARKNEGRGADMLAMLCQPLTIDGSNVRIEEGSKRGYVWIVE